MDRYTHAQSHTCVNTEPTQAELESHAPIVQAHTHLNKTLKRQRAIHVDRYTHAQSHRTHTSREPCTNSTSSIAHPLEQNAQEAESYTRGQVHTCTELTQAESHAPIVQAQSHTHLNKTLKRQRATHGQVHTCSVAQNTELTQAESHAPIVQAQSHTHLNKTLKRQRAIHMDRYTHAQSHTRVNTELTQAESHAPIVQAQSCTHLNKTLKRQRAIHMDRYTQAQSHTHTSR